MIVRESTRAVPVILTTLLAAATLAPAGDGPAGFDDLKRDHKRAAAANQQRFEQAKTDNEREVLQATIWEETRATAHRAFAWAQEHPEAPDSLDAVIWTVLGLANGTYPEYLAEQARAYELLTRDEALASEKVVPVCYYAGGGGFACPQIDRFLEAALEKSPIRLVRGTACLGLARDHHAMAATARRLRDPIARKQFLARWKGELAVIERVERLNPDDLDRRAGAEFERVIGEFGDLKMPHPYNETPFAALAQGELYELRHLTIGKVAPSLDGQDLSGRELRLEDYRGKVVAIVFWSTWCGPCMAMVPHERELVKRMEGRPFVLLGVNGDDDRAKAKEVATKEGITWRSIWNGGAEGGIVERMGVRSWPTIYVLDGEGVIRYKNVYEKSLDEAVERIVAEAETRRKK